MSNTEVIVYADDVLNEFVVSNWCYKINNINIYYFTYINSLSLQSFWNQLLLFCLDADIIHMMILRF